MKQTVFDIFHPAVAAAYFAAVLGCVMALFHPMLLVCALIAGAAYSVYLRGLRTTLFTLAWQLPLLAVIALLNPLFVGSGSTELFRIGDQPFYAEALAYGACMGCMLVAMLLWMSCATQVITSDKLMALTGKALPTIGLMLSLASRLVPQFLRQGKTIAQVQTACTAASVGEAGKSQAEQRRKGRPRISRPQLRELTALMAWSMEDSLETSDAMLARGWGATRKRTTYARTSWRAADTAALAIIAALTAASIACALIGGAGFTFYPRIQHLLPLSACAPFALLALLPLFAEALRQVLWSRS